MAGLSTKVFRDGHDVAVGRTHVENRASHGLMAGLGFSRVETRTPNIAGWVLRADAGWQQVWKAQGLSAWRLDGMFDDD